MPSSALLQREGAPPLRPRVTFLRKESHQRFARNLLVPGPPAKGASPPLIPRPCILAVLVAGVWKLRHPRGNFSCTEWCPFLGGATLALLGG